MASHDNPLPFDPSNDDGFLSTLEVDPSEVADLFTDTASEPSDDQAHDGDDFDLDEDTMLGTVATPEPAQATNGTDPAPMPTPAAATPQTAAPASVPPTPTSATSPTPAPALPAEGNDQPDDDPAPSDGDQEPDQANDRTAQAPAPGKAVFTFTIIADSIMVRRDLSFGEKAVLGMLGRFALMEDKVARPSLELLAAQLGTGERNCRKMIAELESKGLVLREDRPGRPNIYRLPRNDCSALYPGTIIPPTPEQPFRPTRNDHSAHPGTVVPPRILLKKQGRKPTKKQPRNDPPEKAQPSKPVCSIPAQLDFPEFIAAWESWQTYRRELKKPLVPSTIKAQLENLATHPNDAVAIIRQAITKGWQGLFPLKDQTAPRLMPGRAAPVSQLEDMGWPNPEDYEPGGRLCQDKPKYADKSQGVRHAN